MEKGLVSVDVYIGVVTKLVYCSVVGFIGVPYCGCPSCSNVVRTGYAIFALWEIVSISASVELYCTNCRSLYSI